MKVLFISLDEAWTNYANSLGYETYCGKVEEYVISDDVRNVYFVSPANSLGFMDGGIDKAYSQEMFPGIEPLIKNNIKSQGYVTSLGRPYLPIGKAIITRANDRCSIITAPTMLLPQDVSGTQNAFFATIAVLQLLKNIDCDEADLLVLPSLCCGWGKMHFKDSVNQINAAFEQAENYKIDLNVILKNQPNFYMNKEWFD